MLTIVVPGKELFDDETQTFFTIDDVVLELEHSLVSLSKWEEIHEKPFLSVEQKTPEEMLSYIRLMVLTKNPPEDVFYRMTEENVEAINAYINRKMTATWIPQERKGPSRETVTADLIYYWMTAFQIPLEFERRHLNKLFTLVRVASIKNAPPKKQARSEILARNHALNEKRKAELGTKG